MSAVPPSAPTPPPAAPAAPPVQFAPRKIEIELPDHAKVHDKLAFALPVGPGGAMANFSAVVPENAVAGKKIGITVPVLHDVGPGPLIVTRLTLNGLPVQPKITLDVRELHLATNEHRQRVDTHFNKFGGAERAMLEAVLETGKLRPASTNRVPITVGRWDVQRPMHHVPAVARWGEGAPASTIVRKELHRRHFSFGGGPWTLVVDCTPRPWRASARGKKREREGEGGEGGANGQTAAEEAEAEPSRDGVCSGVDGHLGAVLRRETPVGADGSAIAAPPMSICVLIEFADRWSRWQRTSLAPGEEFEFDFGDRTSLGALLNERPAEASQRLRLWMTTATPGTTVVTRSARPVDASVMPAQGLAAGLAAAGLPPAGLGPGGSYTQAQKVALAAQQLAARHQGAVVQQAQQQACAAAAQAQAAAQAKAQAAVAQAAAQQAGLQHQQQMALAAQSARLGGPQAAQMARAPHVGYSAPAGLPPQALPGIPRGPYGAPAHGGVPVQGTVQLPMGAHGMPTPQGYPAPPPTVLGGMAGPFPSRPQ